MLKLFAAQALLPDGWARDVYLECDPGGRFARVSADRPDLRSTPGTQTLAGPVLPGLVNVHTHSFQRGMAGLAERAGAAADDNFWTWREVMYRFLGALDPDDVETIATWLYIELLRCGFTTVVEFHYLHHDRDGQPYSDRAELALRLLRAAERAGIAITLLPVLYAHSGFGGAPPTSAQRRFVHDIDSYLRLCDDLHTRLQAPLDAASTRRLGIAPHSLRAVTPPQLAAAIAHIARLDPTAPVHIHAAEQQAEVAASRAALGAAPVEWLLENAPIDRRFCLIHATHMTPDECQRLARSGAVAGLCPTTEANLGDGLFDAPRYLQQGGHIAVGTDSNVGVDPFAELRLFEYGQRLTHRRRNLLAPAGASVGGTLLRAALSGGAQAAAQPTSHIAVGQRADLVVLDGSDPNLCGRVGDAIADGAIFGPASATELVTDVFVAGRPVLIDRQHAHAPAARAAYTRTLARLL